MIEIGRLALSNNAGLTEINVAEANPAFASADGVMFNKDMTTLIYYPNGKAGVYTILDGVRTIGDEAFGDVSHITYRGTAGGAPWGANGMN